MAAAVDANAITDDEAQQYLASLEDADRRGAFIFAGLAIAATATRS